MVVRTAAPPASTDYGLFHFYKGGEEGHNKLNIIPIRNNLQVGQTDFGTNTNFLTVPLVSWWPAQLQF